MIFTLTFKTPGIYDQIEAQAFSATEYVEDSYDNPHARADKMYDLKEECKNLANKFVKWAEYIVVEFDTEKKTVKVLPTGG